ncbi:hypothetical protein [Parahaliea maris]|uniref:hypothetical protein n=1 Tax=Parahaliea maris TaxID=2716870 RepID=UPI0011CE9E45|nr:hypothetical protein [Parahaliea maris]
MRDVTGDRHSIHLLLQSRLARIQDQGWEGVHQVEDQILDTEYRNAAWLGDMFEQDALMHSYRRRLLDQDVLTITERDKCVGNMSRIVIPLKSASGVVTQSLECWLQGRDVRPAELVDLVELYMCDLANLEGCQIES